MENIPLMQRILSAILFLCALCAAAQPEIKFRDDFDNNYYGWATGGDKDHTVSVKGGKYVYDINNDWAYWHSRLTGISAATKFRIEGSFTKQPGGGENSSCGIMLTDTDWNRYMFLVNPTHGDFVITKNGASDNSWQDLSAWAKNAAIAGEGKANILRMEKNGTALKFFINGKEVFSSSNASYYSNLNGYVYIQGGYGKIKMECDYIDVSYETDVNLLPDCVKGYKKVNLGPNVNTAYDEIGPLITSDGKTLYYSIKGSPENTGGTSDNDEVWYCTALNDTAWSMRKNIGRPINTKSTNMLISISPDNNYALLMNQYDEEGEVKGKGVSSTRMGKKGWELPEPIMIKNFENLSNWNEYCLSADGNYLLMAIQTKNSLGDRDIYVSIRNKRNKVTEKLGIGNFLNKVAGDMWSEPINLGKVVNTAGGEMSPFLAADGVTLYYASNGHKGFGGMDIWVTRRLDDTWTNWSVPQNLGPDINTSGWEGYYTVPASGKYAYMVTGDGAYGKGDIVRIQLPASARPRPVLLVRGKVLNAKTREPVEAAISYRELKTNEEMGAAVSNPNTGEYQIVLPYGKAYSFIADKKGFFAVNDNLDATGITEYAEIERDLYLTPIEVGTVVRLNNIFFDFNKATLKEESFPELDRVIAFLKDNKNMQIEINGHTDNVGGDDYNLKLSDDRSKSVYDYLMSKGIDGARLKYKGYGETKPVSTNDTEEGKAMNRRVEFVILKK